MDNRPQWGTRAGFIMAAVGSAIGLGNIWRFPAVAYENGGGAFFLPYLFALLTAGIPYSLWNLQLVISTEDQPRFPMQEWAKERNGLDGGRSRYHL